MIQTDGIARESAQGNADKHKSMVDASAITSFQEEHLPTGASGIAREFRYYFAQREAIETIIYLYEVAAVKDKVDLISDTF